MPQISLGLPVYNGENFLRQAIDSVLAQEYSDFELIICDNASTDQTEAICRDYAARDRRVRYNRNEENIGAAPNFNKAFAPARGTYFKWIAHDDVIAPTFLKRCENALRSDPSAILACPHVRIIDAEGAMVEDYDDHWQTDSDDPAVRFGELLKGHRCYEVFGLIRREALQKTQLIGNYSHGDGVLLAHLALMGRFTEISERLLFARRHKAQSMYRYGVYESGKMDYEAYAEWFDPKNRDRPNLPSNRLLLEYLRVIQSAAAPGSVRRRAYRMLGQWTRRRWRVIAGEWKRSLFMTCGFSGRARQRNAREVSG